MDTQTQRRWVGGLDDATELTVKSVRRAKPRKKERKK